MSTAAQITANRTNSQFSSGPKTEAGKAIASHNAVKSALTGQTILLPTDDVALYQTLLQSRIDVFLPVGYQEEALVQNLADLDWRLRRIPNLEAGIAALGRIEFAELYPEINDLKLRLNLIDTQVLFKYERQIRNLNLQESRLVRMREKDLLSLRQIQAERKQKELAALKAARSAAAASKIGFEFSTPPIQPSAQPSPAPQTAVSATASGQAA